MTISSKPTIVLVNYNGGNTLRRCLHCLARQTADHHVLVIDNASTDGSLRAAYLSNSPGIQFRPLRRNVGFARAVNIAAAHIDSEIMILLNPDTVPESTFVEKLTQPFTTDRDLGSVSGVLTFASNSKIVASAGIDFHANGVALDARLGETVDSSSAIQPIFGATGGAGAFRRKAFVEAGGFPETFFMYLEDVDLAWRLRLRGWRSVCASAARATHDYSVSAGEGSPFKRRLLARNRIWTIVRCMPDELLIGSWSSIITFDAIAFGYGVLRDQAAVRGRAEALARLLPRLCERRQIQRSRVIDSMDLDSWLKPAVSPFRLRRLRRLTRTLAVHSESAQINDLGSNAEISDN